jgi:hypothetical protein
MLFRSHVTEAWAVELQRCEFVDDVHLEAAFRACSRHARCGSCRFVIDRLCPNVLAERNSNSLETSVSHY